MTGHLNGMGGSLTVKLVTTAGVASDKRKRRNEGDDDSIIGGGMWWLMQKIYGGKLIGDEHILCLQI